MLCLCHVSGTEDRTNDTISFSGITVAKGSYGFIQIEETHMSYNHELLLQIYKIAQPDRTTAEAVIFVARTTSRDTAYQRSMGHSLTPMPSVSSR